MTGERAAGATAAVLQRQVFAAPRDVDPSTAGTLVFAYEPLWGSGLVRRPLGHGDAHTRTRANVASVLGTDNAQRTRILYGGSVDPQNAASLWALAESMGALAGGAGLDPRSFAAIVRTARLRTAASR